MCIVKCEDVEDSRVATFEGVAPLQKPCFEHLDEKRMGQILGTECVKLWFPDGPTPAIGRYVTALVLEGSLESVSISTSGISNEIAVLNQCGQKYSNGLKWRGLGFSPNSVSNGLRRSRNSAYHLTFHEV